MIMNETADTGSADSAAARGADITALLGSLSRDELHRLFDGLRARLDEGTGVGPMGAGPTRESLTGREREVLILIASGYTRAQIARALSISTNTAATHVGNIYRKLDVRSIAEATRFAVRKGIVQLV